MKPNQFNRPKGDGGVASLLSSGGETRDRTNMLHASGAGEEEG